MRSASNRQKPLFMLERVQTAFMAALDHGPTYLPFELFGHSPERTLLGIKVHANTVSHARLVALEDTFPRTRVLLGGERFHMLSRSYLERPGVTALGLNMLGRDFPLHLAQMGDAVDGGDMAAFEWAWLASYNAADANALVLVDLADLAPETLLEVVVERHPAALLGPASIAVCAALADELPDLADADYILLTRPDVDVILRGIDRSAAVLFQKLDEPRSIGNLFALCCESTSRDCISQDRFMPALIDLIDAGALRRVG